MTSAARSVSQLKSIRDCDLQGKTVLIRADLNVPADFSQKKVIITDATRIELSYHTIDYCLSCGANVRLISHFGRPKSAEDNQYSLYPVHEYMKEKYPDMVFNVAREGRIQLLENLRFNAGEKANDADFAESLAEGVDVYVNDAFSVSHRAHASVEAITKILPSYAGLLLEEEVQNLSQLKNNVQRPMLAIMGGAKVSSKIGVIESLIEKVDQLWLVGGLMQTFMVASGFSVGKSQLVESDYIDTAKALLEKYSTKLKIPNQVVVKAEDNVKICHIDSVPESGVIVDTAPSGMEDLFRDVNLAKTIVWNGAAGIFEDPQFAKGTFALAQKLSQRGAASETFVVAGGGETLASIKLAGAEVGYDYLSASGGAFLEYLEDKKLPGLARLFV